MVVHRSVAADRPVDDPEGATMPGIMTSDDVRLWASDDGDGPPVVLVAGYTAPAASWAFQIDALTAAGYRAIGLDRRSHGRSEAPAFGQRMARHGKDLDDAMIQLGLGPVVLVGGSMGASAIWAYVDLFGTDVVRGIVSIDQTPRMINDSDWTYGFYGLTADNSGAFFADGIPATGRGRTVDPAAPAIVRLLERVGPEGLPGNLRPETLPLLRDHAQQDWRDVIARVEVPVLMVAGRDSQYWPCEHAAAAVRGMPNGRAVVLEDCGHAANFDRVDDFNAIMIKFLEEL
jgi:pimeloyl-ACP methyl ester carboxylesterase